MDENRNDDKPDTRAVVLSSVGLLLMGLGGLSGVMAVLRRIVPPEDWHNLFANEASDIKFVPVGFLLFGAGLVLVYLASRQEKRPRQKASPDEN